MKKKLYQIFQKAIFAFAVLITINTAFAQAPGNALNFNGVNDYVSTPSTTIGNFGTSAFTIETWIRTTQSTLHPTIVNKRNVCNGVGFWNCGLKNGTLEMEVGEAAGFVNYHVIDGTISVSDGKWHHIAYTRSAAGLLSLYVDGVLDVTATPTAITNISNNFPIKIASSICGNNGYIANLNGSLDEMRIWDVEKTQVQLQASMYNVISASSANLIAYYNFDNGVANSNNTGVTTLTDLSSNANNGTVINLTLNGNTSNWVESYAMVVPTATVATSVTGSGFTANWTVPTVGTVTNYLLDVATDSSFSSFVSGYNGLSVAGTSQAVTGLSSGTTYYFRVRADKASVTGQGGNSNTITQAVTIAPPGNALHFDGVDDYVSAAVPFTYINNFTIETWINPSSFAGGNKGIFSYGYDNTLVSDGVNMAIDASGTLFYNHPSVAAYNTGYTLTTNKWYHIAITRSGGVSSTYVNGVLVFSTSATNPIAPTDFNIGSHTFNRFFNGKIDEFRFYNTALTQAQIQSDAFSTSIAVPASLVLYYNFDNGVSCATNTGVTTATDISGNSRNGTLNNFALATGCTSNWVESYAMVIPTATAATSATANGFTANWTAPAIGTVDNYLLDVSTSSSFSSFVSGYNGLSVAGTSQAVTGLSLGTTYYYRVRADKTSVTGQGGYSNTITQAIVCTLTTGTFTTSACDSYIWVAKGNKVYTASNTTDTIHLTNVGGCDSLVTLNLTISNGTHLVSNQTVCDSLIWKGTTYKTSGTYTFSYNNSNSCASVDTLKLVVNNGTHLVSTQTVCDSLIWNGTTYKTSGTYTFSYNNSNGCASVDTLKLVVNNGTHLVSTQTVCDSLIWKGTTYKTSGIYTFSYNNTNGCASVDTLKLVVNNGTHLVSTQTVCDSLIWNGTTYKTSGTYTFSYNNTNGCASVDTLKLVVNNGTHLVSTQTVCDSLIWNGTTYKTSGTYTFSYNNSNGCASVDTLKLVVNNGTHLVSNQTVCDSLIWNGTTYKTSGTYTFSYNNANGCASVDTLKLTINITPASPTITTSTLNVTIPATGVAYSCSTVSVATSYTWSYTGTGVTIATGQGTENITADFAANATNGDIQVVANNGTCSSTTATVTLVLPITLSNFTATKVNNTVVLQWNSKVEINAKEYQVQRSIDGRNFETIGTVAAKGFASEYSFIDPLTSNNLPLTIYYRLKQVDKDGKFQLSAIRTLNLKPETLNVSIYPNPTTNVLNIKGLINSLNNVIITGMLGKVVIQLNHTVQKSINVANLNAGTYFIKINNESSIKFIKE